MSEQQTEKKSRISAFVEAMMEMEATAKAQALRERYETGVTLTELAKELEIPIAEVRERLEDAGATIRLFPRPRARREGEKDPDYFRLGHYTPVPKQCGYGCGRTAPWGSFACTACSISPPCTCPEPHRIKGRKYMGEWTDLRCGLPIRAGGAQ